MTVKRLQSGYWDGYVLGAQYSELVIGPATTVGGYGVFAKQTATIVNHGSVVSPFGDAVYLPAGGKVINGGANDTTALLAGRWAVVASGRYGDQATTLVNFGTVRANNFYSGVSLYGGGVLTNGSNADSRALIAATGEIAVDAVDVRLSNFGTIQGGLVGVLVVNLEGGASLVNGSAADTTALILGGTSGPSCGIDSRGQAAAIRNFGTIEAASGDGVYLNAGWTLTNGSPKDHVALISGGYYGVEANAGSAIVNFATIAGNGVSLASHARIVNGSARDSTALVSGKIGVIVGEYGTTGTISNFATVENFGTIEGVGGPSVEFDASGDRLIARAGSVFIGVADVGQSILDVISGVSTFAGGVDTSGTLTGAGTVALTGGTTTFGAGTKLNVADIEESGALTQVDLEVSLFDSRQWTQTSGTVTVGSGERLTFDGVDDSFAGTLAGAGDVAFTGGSGTLAGTTLAAALVLIDGATVTMTGSATLDGAVTQSSNVTLGGLTAVAASLTIESGATWSINGDAGVAIGRSYKSAITVDGTLIKTGGVGVSRIDVAITDDGLVAAASGVLDLAARVLGSGVLQIDAGATLELDGGAAKTITATFDGSGATLDLAAPTMTGATISGFTVGDTIDLLNVAATKATLNKLDQLIVFNGTTRVSTLQLTGSYQGETFAVVSDGHGGSAIALAQAMASMAPDRAGATTTAFTTAAKASPPQLLSPGAH